FDRSDFSPNDQTLLLMITWVILIGDRLQLQTDDRHFFLHGFCCCKSPRKKKNFLPIDLS
ncbi:hypothetical protein C7B69_26700, partial [filamentous cyanobacterium Phorm 46]